MHFSICILICILLRLHLYLCYIVYRYVQILWYRNSSLALSNCGLIFYTARKRSDNLQDLFVLLSGKHKRYILQKIQKMRSCPKQSHPITSALLLLWKHLCLITKLGVYLKMIIILIITPDMWKQLRYHLFINIAQHIFCFKSQSLT